jgi:hypothetical protein
MRLRKVGLGLLGALAISWSAGLSAQARADVTLKLTVQEMTLKKKPTKSEMKSTRSFAHDVEKKVIDERTMHLSYGTPKELVLPNGSKLILNAISFSTETKKLKMHVTLQVADSGFDSDVSLLENHHAPVNAGPYGAKSVLVVMLSPLSH